MYAGDYGRRSQKKLVKWTGRPRVIGEGKEGERDTRLNARYHSTVGNYSYELGEEEEVPKAT